MYSFINDQEFMEKRNNGQYHVFRSLSLVTPTWEDLSFEFNRCLMEKDQLKIFENFGFVLHAAENIPHVESVLREYSKCDPTLSASAHCYISFLPFSRTFEEHTDNTDVLYWQCAGEVKWVVQGNEYILKPNDAVYVPRNMKHYALPFTPRFGISLGLD